VVVLPSHGRQILEFWDLSVRTESLFRMVLTFGGYPWCLSVDGGGGHSALVTPDCLISILDSLYLNGFFGSWISIPLILHLISQLSASITATKTGT
jgi:hypothetical protein